MSSVQLFFLLFQESGEVDACHLTFNQNGASSIPFSLIYWIIICQVPACLGIVYEFSYTFSQVQAYLVDCI
ncbi:hypothetical protein B1748_14125 [Paenibacillus sp. MY03]|nr:hypothetical protein B1748_14125 [Paenibacillus sp. MY03]